jgi:hypothetical protein
VDTVQDFEDLLELLDRHGARYLIVGGLAFIYHAKPRYTKDMDLWVDEQPDNVHRVNLALTDFGSPQLLDVENPDEILQLGAAPNRIDLIRSVIELDFAEVWNRRIQGSYGRAPANWIDLDSLIAIKSGIDHPRHQEDARILRLVRNGIGEED